MTYKLDDFEILELIGKGSFASCFKVRNKHTKEILVWKAIEYGELPEDKKQLLVTEVSLLRDLRHPNIVNYYDRIVCKETKQLFILIEYCPGGDLATLIQSCIRVKSYVEEHFVWRVLHQLSSALQACHSWLSTSVVLHRDIKPANVFLDCKGDIKLGDFGLACKLDVGQVGCVETMVGTPFYMSPEVMKGQIYNSKSDVWSLGCLVYELCALSPPFNAENIIDLAAKINKGRFPRIPSYYLDELQKILKSLLVVNQEQRPSIFEIVRHSVILSHVQEAGNKQSNASKPPGQVELSSRTTPLNVLDRDPEKVSKDTFRGEWMARLQSLRDREAAIRCREHQLDEREYSVLRREHRVAIMERMVRDKMVLAEVYLKRSRDTRHTSTCPPGGSVGVRHLRPQASAEIDESFSADAGDSSIMPTSALLDPSQVPKPMYLAKSPPMRRVHFDDRVHRNGFNRSKPIYLKVAESIRNQTTNGEAKPRMQQKILHLPGYTGPAITVDVPVSEAEDTVPSPEIRKSMLTSSPSVKLTVLFDDRGDLKKATSHQNQLDALNLETKRMSKEHLKKNICREFTDVYSRCENPNRPLKDVKKSQILKKFGASVDSLLDASLVKQGQTTYSQLLDCGDSAPSTLDQNGDVAKDSLPLVDKNLIKNAFGGSLRYKRQLSCRSRSTSSSETKAFQEKQAMSLDNIKNDALVCFEKGLKHSNEMVTTKKMLSTLECGKENYPAREFGRSKKNSTSRSKFSSTSAASSSAAESLCKKTHTFIR